MSLFLKEIFLIGIIAWYSFTVCGENIRFKNGKVIEGAITGRDTTSIKVDIGGIALTYYLDEIESIDGKQIVSLSSSEASSGQKREVSGTKVFKDSVWGYSLVYPADWEVIPEAERKSQFAAGLRPLGPHAKHATVILHHRYLRPDELAKAKDIRALAQLFPPPSELRLVKAEEVTINNKPAYHARYTYTAPYTTANVEGRSINLSGETVAHYDYYYCTSAFSSDKSDTRLFVLFSQYFQYAGLAAKDNPSISAEDLAVYRREQESFNRAIDTLAGQLAQIVHSLDYSLAPTASAPSGPVNIPAPTTLPLGKLKEAQDMLQKARGLLREKKYAEAIAQLEKVVAIDPQLAEAHLMFGEAYMMTGQYEKSSEAFKQCLALAPNYPSAHVGFASLYRARNQIQDALVHLQRAIDLNSEYFEAKFLLGSLYAQLGRNQEAVALLEEVAPQMPAESNAYTILGFAYLYDSRLEKAIEIFKIAIRKNKADADAYHGLGSAYMALSRFSEAKLNLQQARALLQEKSDDEAARQTIQAIDELLKRL